MVLGSSGHTHNIDEQDKTGTQVTEEKSGVQLEYNIPWN